MADSTVADDPRVHIDQSPMSRAQIAAVAILGTLAALDGYDVLAVTFASPGITAAWGIDRAALGVVLSMGLLGMALGSFFLSPLADRFGRKPLVLATLALMAGGMAASAFATNVTELSFWRVITGLGIGGMISVVVAMTAEYANARHRPLAVAVVALGYPIGGVIGGSIAASLLYYFDWRAVFWLGAVAALIMAPIVMLWAPESISYLLTRKSEKALAHLNRVLARCRKPLLASMPIGAVQVDRPRSSIFSRDEILPTLHVTAMNFLFVVTVYYMLSWMPQMTADAGYGPTEAASVSVIASLSGVVGGTILGLLVPLVGVKPAGLVAFLGLAAATVAFGFTPPTLDLLQIAGGVVGFFLFPGMVAIYTIIARSFPAETRATGTGFVVGMGRGSSALAPLIAGFMFASGLGRDGVSMAMAVCALAAAVVLVFLRVRQNA
ncbi:MAG: MFS transporter [Hyphomonadaceae bacterium]